MFKFHNFSQLEKINKYKITNKKTKNLAHKDNDFIKSLLVNDKNNEMENLIYSYNNLTYTNNGNTIYNTTFPNLNSDVLIYLAMWQYWWWFWFLFLSVFYYIFIVKTLFNRQKKINPRINTSIKSHGKWGDLIVGLIPIYWCINILTNSNFLLKTLEWQTESNLFTVRIRGKQWYWIYKIDVFQMNNVMNLNKNVGHNNIISLNSKSSEIEQFTRLINHVWHKLFFKRIKSPILTTNKYKKKNINFKLNNATKKLNWGNELIFLNKKFNLNNNKVIFKKLKLNLLNLEMLKNKPNNVTQILNRKIKIKQITSFYTYNQKLFFKKYDINMYSRQKSTNFNFCLRKFNKKLIFVYRSNHHKKYKNNMYFIIKQTRFNNFENIIETKKKLNVNFFNKISSDVFKDFRRSNTYALNMSNRLLNTNTVLVLPANINMATITNSYDVIHSWFVPGLGIKMDCVPGRSTHHTFYFDVYGLFFGQCAEICGRFHHHMPIKIAIVYYEIFLLWFNHVAIKTIFKRKK